MTDWTDGYVTSIDYTVGYYHHLNPMRARLAILERGLAFPNVENACELGFGQGLSVNIHAAASTTRWYGTDFNPTQAAFARELAAASGAEARLFNEDFETFTRRGDLPDFDFIGLHGVWSWVSDDNRRLIVDFLRRKLKEGGVVYISYNILPGWGDVISMRHLMAEYLNRMDERHQNIKSRIKNTIDFANKLIALNPAIKKSFPKLDKFMETINRESVYYLAHEYFNKEWCPMHFFDIKEFMDDAQLQYACSANFLCNHFLDITQEQVDFIKSINDQVIRETVYDFMNNTVFRSDLWIKGTTRENEDNIELLENQQVILSVPRDNIPHKVVYGTGTLTLNGRIYDEILDLMSDLKPRTFHQIKLSIENKISTDFNIYPAIILLIDIKCLDLFQDDAVDDIKTRTSRLNAVLRSHSQQGKNIEFLASPVTGGGINVSRVSQLFLTSLDQGQTSPQEWAEYALQNFSQLGERLVKDGRTLGMEDEKRAELRERAEIFAQRSLPILKALGVA